jgi:uncharacterized damage-inducible protein DinB
MIFLGRDVMAEPLDPPTMELGEHVAHIAAINYSFCAALKDTKLPTLPDPKSKPEIVKFLADSFDCCTEQIKTVTEAQMNAIHSTPDRRLNGRELLLGAYVHLAHHRGQAETYLRIKGNRAAAYVF